jgi:hypothetical protein
MERRGLLIGAGVVAAGILVSGLLLRAADQRWKRAAAVADEIDNTRARNSVLEDSLMLLMGEVDRAREGSSFRTGQASAARQSERILLNEFDISDLKKKGLKEPVNDLRRDLMRRRELIPFEGVLGGTMGFIEASIVPLSRQWVYAEFEDGHIGGRCVLSYEVGPGGSLSWRVLSAALD